MLKSEKRAPPVEKTEPPAAKEKPAPAPVAPKVKEAPANSPPPTKSKLLVTFRNCFSFSKYQKHASFKVDYRKVFNCTSCKN